MKRLDGSRGALTEAPPPRRKIPKSRPIILANGPAQYTCSECGRSFTWVHGSAWFGSIADMDDSKPLIYACDKACRERLAQVLNYPPDSLGEG